jgi:hypothetical protein
MTLFGQRASRGMATMALIGGFVCSVSIAWGVAAPESANAQGATYNNANDTLSCSWTSGRATYSPGLSNTNILQGTVAVSGKLAGCNDAALPKVKITGLVTGTLSAGNWAMVLTAGGCEGWFGGPLTITWHSGPIAGYPGGLALTSSTFVPNGVAVAVVPGGGHNSFPHLEFGNYQCTPGPSVTGAFTGGNSGATSTANLPVSQSVHWISAHLDLASLTLNIGAGNLTLS